MQNRSFFLLFLLIITSRSQAQRTTIRFDDPHIHYMGRVAMTHSAALLFWTATSVSVNFIGTGIGALLKDERGDNYYTIVLDGKPVNKLHLDSLKHLYTLATGLPPGLHSLELFKSTEWAMGKTWLYSLSLEDHTNLLPAP